VPRPHKCRFVDGQPAVRAFKPVGVPGRTLLTVTIRLDELEAMRLADAQGLYHDTAAEQMGISRATFGRLVQEARRKVASALLDGRMIVFEGGTVAEPPDRVFTCADCGTSFGRERGTGRPQACPACGSDRVWRSDHGGGWGRGRCFRGWRHGGRARRGGQWANASAVPGPASERGKPQQGDQSCQDSIEPDRKDGGQ
jgi:predicted DNA-binding protein (UPF0251 family)